MFNADFYPEVPIFWEISATSAVLNQEFSIQMWYWYMFTLVTSTTLWPGTPCSLGLHRSCRQITCVAWQRSFGFQKALPQVLTESHTDQRMCFRFLYKVGNWGYKIITLDTYKW